MNPQDILKEAKDAIEYFKLNKGLNPEAGVIINMRLLICILEKLIGSGD